MAISELGFLPKKGPKKFVSSLELSHIFNKLVTNFKLADCGNVRDSGDVYQNLFEDLKKKAEWTTMPYCK